MRHLMSAMSRVHIEAVTTAFVASGGPEGIHDLGRLLESLNNPTIATQLELHDPTVRPLYNATSQLQLGAPLLIRRDDIIFCTFEGPYFTRGTIKPAMADTPVLLMLPPFQISGVIGAGAGADATQAMRQATRGFFIVRDATVYDTDGNGLGEGEQIIVNGDMVQLASATAQRIGAAAPAAPARRSMEGVLAEEPAAAPQEISHAA